MSYAAIAVSDNMVKNGGIAPAGGLIKSVYQVEQSTLAFC